MTDFCVLFIQDIEKVRAARKILNKIFSLFWFKINSFVKFFSIVQFGFAFENITMVLWKLSLNSDFLLFILSCIIDYHSLRHLIVLFIVIVNGK